MRNGKDKLTNEQLELVKTLSKVHNLSPVQIADKIKRSPATVRNILNGTYGIVKVEVVEEGMFDINEFAKTVPGYGDWKTRKSYF